MGFKRLLAKNYTTDTHLKIEFYIEKTYYTYISMNFFSTFQKSVLGQIGATSQWHIHTLHRFFASDHLNMSKIDPSPWKIWKKILLHLPILEPQN